MNISEKHHHHFLRSNHSNVLIISSRSHQLETRESKNEIVELFPAVRAIMRNRKAKPDQRKERKWSNGKPLLQLLLGSELRGVTTLALSAVGSSRRESSVALSADLLVTLLSRKKRGKL